MVFGDNLKKHIGDAMLEVKAAYFAFKDERTPYCVIIVLFIALAVDYSFNS